MRTLSRVLIAAVLALAPVAARADFSVQVNGSTAVAITIPATQATYCGLTVSQASVISHGLVPYTVWVGATLSGPGTSVPATQSYTFACSGSTVLSGTVGWIKAGSAGNYSFIVTGIAAPASGSAISLGDVRVDTTNHLTYVGHLPVISDLHVASQTSGSLAPGTYGYCVLGVNVNGFWPDYGTGNYTSGISVCSNIVYATVTSSAVNGTVNLGWTALPAFDGPYLQLERCSGAGCGSNLANFGTIYSSTTAAFSDFYTNAVLDDGTGDSNFDSAEPPPAADTSFIAVFTDGKNPDNPGYVEMDFGPTANKAGASFLNGLNRLVSDSQLLIKGGTFSGTTSAGASWTPGLKLWAAQGVQIAGFFSISGFGSGPTLDLTYCTGLNNAGAFNGGCDIANNSYDADGEIWLTGAASGTSTTGTVQVVFGQTNWPSTPYCLFQMKDEAAHWTAGATVKQVALQGGRTATQGFAIQWSNNGVAMPNGAGGPGVGIVYFCMASP